MLPEVSRIRRLSGFGKTSHADSYRYEPETLQDILTILEFARQTNRPILNRGAGRSYGDAAVFPEAVAIDFQRMNQILSFDPETGILEAEPGTTLDQICHAVLPKGWYLPVVSGTAKTTLGGAISMNIHGKNHFLRGNFGEHVLGLELIDGQGEIHWIDPGDNEFCAIIGGLGLLGIVTRAKIQLKRVESSQVRVQAVSCASWAEHFAAFERFEGDAEYVVSWIDSFARGSNEGRGVLHAGWHAPAIHGFQSQNLPDKILGIVPKNQVWRILKLLNHPAPMRLVNAAKHLAGKREAKQEHFQSLAEFNYLLDYVPNWERSYAPGGLIQCQYFLPKHLAYSVFSRITQMQQTAGLVSYLTVMKRHRQDSSLLPHTVDGFSLAMDFKVTASNKGRVWDLARQMNEITIESGGRCYFAKDSTLTPTQAYQFLGHSLEEFKVIKNKLDPDHIFTSSLAARLELIPDPKRRARDSGP